MYTYVRRVVLHDSVYHHFFKAGAPAAAAAARRRPSERASGRSRRCVQQLRRPRETQGRSRKLQSRRCPTAAAVCVHLCAKPLQVLARRRDLVAAAFRRCGERRAADMLLGEAAVNSRELAVRSNPKCATPARTCALAGSARRTVRGGGA